MSWQIKEGFKQVLQREQGSVVFPPGSRAGFALVYPNTYHVGMSNLGFQIIYQQINSRGDTACERVFLPEKKLEQEYLRTNTPLMTLENQQALYEFPLIGFAVTYELDYFNILKIMKMGKVNILAADRQENEPLIIMGGPCITFNPEPLADFADICIIGEGEEVIHELLEVYYEAGSKLTRLELLQRFAAIPGIYVPRFYEPQYSETGTINDLKVSAGVPAKIERRWVKQLDKYPAHTVITTPDTEFAGMYLVEVARGCGRHCRFCMAGYCYRRPRNRPLTQIAEQIAAAGNSCGRIGLMGAAISDYPEIDRLCRLIRSWGLGLSAASLRADSLTPDLVKALAESGQKTITLAPEAGSARIRKVINKGITEEDIFQAVALASKAGIKNVRLYIMIGLPGETDEDVAEIIVMAEKLHSYMNKLGAHKLTLSINIFIPKPFTPFQWLPAVAAKVAETRLALLNKRLKGQKGIEVLTEKTRDSYIQAALARGDRRLGKVLLTAHLLGGCYKKWQAALKKNAISEEFYLYRQRSQTELLPWQLLDMGLAEQYLAEELAKAKTETFTVPCFAGCTRCGVCQKP